MLKHDGNASLVLANGIRKCILVLPLHGCKTHLVETKRLKERERVGLGMAPVQVFTSLFPLAFETWFRAFIAFHPFKVRPHQPQNHRACYCARRRHSCQRSQRGHPHRSMRAQGDVATSASWSPNWRTAERQEEPLWTQER